MTTNRPEIIIFQPKPQPPPPTDDLPAPIIELHPESEHRAWVGPEPVPARPPQTWVADTDPRFMNAARREWDAAPHTQPEPQHARKVETPPATHGPRHFAATNPAPRSAPGRRSRIGWSLVIAVLAESAVAAAAIATEDYAIGLLATGAMGLCCIGLVLAEAVHELSKDR